MDALSSAYPSRNESRRAIVPLEIQIGRQEADATHEPERIDCPCSDAGKPPAVPGEEDAQCGNEQVRRQSGRIRRPPGRQRPAVDLDGIDIRMSRRDAPRATEIPEVTADIGAGVGVDKTRDIERDCAADREFPLRAWAAQSDRTIAAATQGLKPQPFAGFQLHDEIEAASQAPRISTLDDVSYCSGDGIGGAAEVEAAPACQQQCDAEHERLRMPRRPPSTIGRRSGEALRPGPSVLTCMMWSSHQPTLPHVGFTLRFQPEADFRWIVRWLYRGAIRPPPICSTVRVRRGRGGRGRGESGRGGSCRCRGRARW